MGDVQPSPLLLVVGTPPAPAAPLRAALVACGGRVLVAHDVDNAKAIVASDAPNLVVVDTGLSQEMAVAFVAWLRAQRRPTSGRLAIVVHSAIAYHGHAEAFLDAGVDRYLMRPATLAGVVDAIRATLATVVEPDLGSAGGQR